MSLWVIPRLALWAGFVFTKELQSSSSKISQVVALAAALFLPAGVLMALTADDIPAAAHKIRNPLPKDKATLLAGAAVYRDQCAGCHGPDGIPVKKFPRLRVQPATLSSHDVQRHSDGDLFWILTHGESGGMPSFAEDLNETQRWQTIAFLRHMGKGSAALTAQLPPEKQ